MKQEAFLSLSTGDVIKGHSGEIYLVTANYGGRITAVKTVDLTDPTEWELVLKACYKRPTVSQVET